MATTSTESPDVSVSSTKITDVNIDCLEKICKNLSFEDLLNVADANKHLKKAVDLVYSLKYGNRYLFIQSIETRPKFALRVHCNNVNNIIAYGLKSVLQILRCFGHMISKIIIFPFRKVEEVSFDHMMTYIGEYCADSLTELEFMVSMENALAFLKKPLPNVHKVEILENGLTADLLNRSFPNLKYLEINYGGQFIQNGQCVAIDFANIEKYFQHFDHMDIKSNHSSNRYSLDTQERHECVFDVVKLKTVQPLSDCSKEKLPFHQLEEMQLNFYFKDDENFYTFFSKYPSITKLTLTPQHYNNHTFVENDLNVSRLATAFPWLMQIDLRCCKFTPNAAIHWMGQFNALKKFQFYFEEHSDWIDLQNRLGNEWHGSSTMDGDKFVCDLVRNTKFLIT